MSLRAWMRVGTGEGPVMLMFHGYGNDERAMVRVWDAAFPDPSARPDSISFRAPVERPYLGGWQWYPHGCDVHERRRACARVADEIAALTDGAMFGSRPLMLMGFSQGGYLAYRIARALPDRFDTAILLSPSFVGERVDGPIDGSTRFVLCYGDQDTTIPREDQRRAYDGLRHSGRLTALTYEGMGHAICDQEIEDIRTVVEKRR